MSAGDLYTAKWSERARLKRVRTERLRPLRKFMEGLPGQIRLGDYDSETCWVNNGALGSLEIDLTQPFDKEAILNLLLDGIETQREGLDRCEITVEQRLAALTPEEATDA